MSKYPSVRDFGGSYLHQDWDYDYATWQDALDDWISDSPGMLHGFVAELDDVLASDMTEAELDDFVYPHLDLNYVPPADEGGNRGWLRALRDHVAARR